MWVWAQDKRVLANVYKFEVFESGCSDDWVITGTLNNGSIEVLGAYASESEAKQVLNDIAKTIDWEERPVYYMPKRGIYKYISCDKCNAVIDREAPDWRDKIGYMDDFITYCCECFKEVDTETT